MQHGRSNPAIFVSNANAPTYSSNANAPTYSLNCKNASGQQRSARKSKVFALARSSARFFSAEILRAASRHLFARSR